MARLDPQVAGTILVDDSDSANIYIGTAATGSSTSSAVWRIRLVSTSVGTTTVYYANGSPEYNQIWDNRASLTYTS